MSVADGVRARSFGAVAEGYARWRPGYPPAVLDAVLPAAARRVLDLGAGTGKMTAALVQRGLEVVAVEPDAEMLAVLTRDVPAAHPVPGAAELVPLLDADVDAVVVGQAWHWFDHAAAGAEVRRVLRPGGTLGLAWHTHEPLEEWERALDALDPDGGSVAADDLTTEAMVPGVDLSRVQVTVVRWVWELTPQHVRGTHSTHSAVSTLPAGERDARLAAVLALAEEEAHRRGAPTVLLHMATWCALVPSP